MKKITFSTTSAGERVVSVIGEGAVSRAPDTALVRARIVTHDDVGSEAIVKNANAFEELKTKLAALGLGESKIQATLSSRALPALPPVAAGLALASASAAGLHQHFDTPNRDHRRRRRERRSRSSRGSLARIPPSRSKSAIR